MTTRRRRRSFGGITDSPAPPADPHEALLTVTYWAISILSSRTVWLNTAALLIAALSLTEIVTIVPPRTMPTYTAVVAMLNLFLRTVTVRPVAFIPPGTTKPVTVARVGPPDPPIVTD